jgi:glycosyltransferase involved in cell wall biosynthesis
MPPHEKIRVLHLIGSLAAGGAERNLYYLGPHFKTSRFHHSICCMMSRGEFAEELEWAGVEIFELGYRRRYFLNTVLRLADLLRRQNIALLHTHLFEPGLVGRLAAWLAGTPVIITHEHGKTLWKKSYHHLFERLALWRTDIRIVVSEDIRDLRKQREGTPDHKLILIENAVDPERFDVDEETRSRVRRDLGVDDFFVVGTVGRLVPAKAYDPFLEAARRLTATNSRMKFLMVGDGSLRADLEARARDLGLEGSVLFLGSRTDIPELLAAMDLYLITSAREGLPISLIEAMLAARPIVSTAVGGIPEALTDGETGLLVESGNAGAITGAVSGLMGQPERREAMGRAAREQALLRYSPAGVLEKLDRLYAGLLERKGIGAGLISA